MKLLTPITKTALWFLLIGLLLFLFASCEPFGYRFDNTYIHVFPEDPQTLYVKHGGGEYRPELNGENYQVEMLTDSNTFRLSVTSLHHSFHFVEFNGYDRKGDEQKELPFEWKAENRSLTLSGPLKENPYSFYELSLSEDNSK